MASKASEELCELISTWLARQIAEARLEEHARACPQCKTNERLGMASVQIECDRRAALESTKAKLTEQQTGE